MTGFIIGTILGILVGFGIAGIMTAAESDPPRWLHPPDDDGDGITRMEDDPDGQCER